MVKKGFKLGHKRKSYIPNRNQLKILNENRYKAYTKEAIEKRVKTRRERNNYKHTEKTKQKIRQSLKKRFPNGKPINSGCFKQGVLKCRTGKSSKSYHKWAREKMEKLKGRKLEFNEIVHHINGNWEDNRLENLRLMSRSKHASLHHSLIGEV